MPSPDQLAWLNTVAAPAAIASEQATGIPATLTLAQAIFESAWGSRAPNNNCFGIKADAHGSGVQYVLTHEYLNGQWEEMPLAFEKYDNLADCFSDHARLIQQGVYASAWGQYQQDHDLDAFIKGVAAHYATDPNYYTEIDAEAHSGTVQNALQSVRTGVAT
jgi:flagellar protein FlgJ